MALIAAHLGVIDEEKIDNMSYVFFEDVLEQLGKKLSYDAVVNYAGNGFCKDSWDMIVDANPMLMGEGHVSKGQREMANFLGNARIASGDELKAMKAHQKVKKE